MRQYAAVCRNAILLSCSPATPFKTGSRLHLSAYGMYGYALMSCLSLRDYFRLGVKYHRLATPTLTIEWTEYPGRRHLDFSGCVHVQSVARIARVPASNSNSCSTSRIFRTLQAEAVRRSKPAFPIRRPRMRTSTASISAVRVISIARNASFITTAHTGAEAATRAQLTATLLQETCDRLIGQAKTSVGVSGEVYQMLMRKPGVFPGMEEVAQALKMTSRTLRRRLESEGTSFRRDRRDVRCSLALSI